MNIELMKYILIILICMYASYTDLKEMKIKNNTIIIALILSCIFMVLDFRFENIICSIVIFLLLFSVSKYIGGGDIKILSIIPLFIGLKIFDLFFFLSIIYLGTYIFMKIKKRYSKKPLAPMIFISLILAII